MDKQKALRLILKFLVFTLAISSSVTVFAVISYANYALFNDWLPTKIFTYIGSIGIGMVTYYLVAIYLGKLVNSFHQQPQAKFIKFYKQSDPFINSCYGVDNVYRDEPKPSFLTPYRRK